MDITDIIGEIFLSIMLIFISICVCFMLTYLTHNIYSNYTKSDILSWISVILNIVGIIVSILLVILYTDPSKNRSIKENVTTTIILIFLICSVIQIFFGIFIILYKYTISNNNSSIDIDNSI